MSSSQFTNPFASPQQLGDSASLRDCAPFRSAIILLWILAGFTMGALVTLGVVILVSTPGGLRMSAELTASILLWGGFAGGAAGAAWARRRVARIDDRADEAASNRRELEVALESVRRERSGRPARYALDDAP